MSNIRKLASRCVGTALKLAPIHKNRIVFSSMNGRGYSDSPKAICEVLRKSGKDLDLVWLCKDEAAAKSLPEGVRAVLVPLTDFLSGGRDSSICKPGMASRSSGSSRTLLPRWSRNT